MQQNTERMCTKTLESLVTLINDKRTARKTYADERQRLEVEFAKVHKQRGSKKGKLATIKVKKKSVEILSNTFCWLHRTISSVTEADHDSVTCAMIFAKDQIKDCEIKLWWLFTAAGRGTEVQRRIWKANGKGVSWPGEVWWSKPKRYLAFRAGNLKSADEVKFTRLEKHKHDRNTLKLMLSMYCFIQMKYQIWPKEFFSNAFSW